jgi:DNA polymerase I-like protein with 3'-5' exonuclease and polymerase domains
VTLDLSIGTPVASEEEMASFIQFATYASHCVVDVEGDPDTNLFLGLGLGFPPSQGMYFPIGHLEDVNISGHTLKLLTHCIEETSVLVMHNAMHDLIELEKIGIVRKKRFACTMTMAHMVDENVPNKGLDYLHKAYTGGTGKNRHELAQQFIDTMGWRYVPVMLMNEYCVQDCVATSELFLQLEPLYKFQFGELFSV